MYQIQDTMYGGQGVLPLFVHCRVYQLLEMKDEPLQIGLLELRFMTELTRPSGGSKLKILQLEMCTCDFRDFYTELFLCFLYMNCKSKSVISF